MSGNNFLNSFMPTLPWWFLVIVLASLATWATVSRVRLWNAQRRRIEHPGKVLRQVKNVLATVISDAAVFGEARDQALSAYESVADALKKENSN